MSYKGKLKKIIIGIRIQEVYRKNNINVKSDYFEYDFFDEHNLFDHEHNCWEDNGKIKFISTEKTINMHDDNEWGEWVVFYGLVLEIGKKENWYNFNGDENDWYYNEDVHEIPLLDIDINETKNKILEKINKLLPFLNVERKDVKWYYIPN